MSLLFESVSMLSLNRVTVIHPMCLCCLCTRLLRSAHCHRSGTCSHWSVSLCQALTLRADGVSGSYSHLVFLSSEPGIVRGN